jgi:ketosteroid isomerase-like protein
MEPIDVVRLYAEAWQANDIAAVFDLYHDDFVLHYFGASPLAGDHVGKEAAIEVLVQATERSGRRLDAIEDVLAGSTFAAIVAREGVRCLDGEGDRMIRRVFLYKVRDGYLSECWLYDEDQRGIDELWSAVGS